MANSFTQVPPNSTGVRLQTFQNTVGGVVVDAQGIVLCDSAGNVISTLPVSSTQLPAALGQNTMAASLPVAIASNQGNVPISIARPTSYIQKSWTASGVAYAGATEAAASLTPATDAVAAAAATTFTVTTGKTWRIQGMFISVTNGAATANTMTFNLRAVPTGTAVNTSPVLWTAQLAQPATAGTITILNPSQIFGPDGLDLKAGWNFGLFNVASIASAGTTIRAAICGYEY